MWLYYLEKIRWLIWTMCILIAGLGVYQLANGIADGWVPLAIGVTQFVFQFYINQEARRPDVDPRETIG